MESDKPMSARAWRLVMIGALVVAVLLIGLVNELTGSKDLRPDPSNPFWFVGLLVIFGASLTLIAIVYRWLGMADQSEAFALPSGSIRTLLAIGIMVLFTVFGLKFFDTAGQAATVPRLANEAMHEVEVPTAEKGAEVKRYREAGLLAMPSGAASAAMVRLKLYRVDVGRPADVVDMQKQMLTAIVTLLTTVIGFYFGSRSAESARDKAAAPERGVDTEFQALDADLKALDGEIATAIGRLEGLKGEEAEPERQAAFQAALSLLLPAADKLVSDRAALGVTLVEVRQQRGTVAPLVAHATDLRRALSALKEQLAAAEQFVAKG